MTIESQFQNTSAESVKDFALNIDISIPLASLDIDLFFETFEQRKQFRATSTSNLQVLGGIPDQSNFNGILAASTPGEVVQTQNTVENWKQTIAANPVIIHYVISPIFNLFTDQSAIDGMKQAAQCYYDTSCYNNYLKSRIPTFVQST